MAARLGRVFGYLLIGVGHLRRCSAARFVSGIWIGFIGFFLAQAARSAEVQTDYTDKIEGLQVASLMDAEPVLVRSNTPWSGCSTSSSCATAGPWFPVVDESDRFLGVVTREQAEDVAVSARDTTTIDEVMTLDPASAFRIRTDDSLETVLGSEGFQRLGALVAVDADSVVRGVVTLDQVKRALA